MPYVKTNASYRTRSKRSRARKRQLLAPLTLLVIVLAIIAFVRGAFVLQPAATVAVRASATPAPAASPAAPWSPGELARVHTMLAQTFAPAIGDADRASLVIIGANGETLYSYGATNV